MPAIVEIKENNDEEAITIKLEEGETEQFLIGKSVGKGVLVSKLIQEILKNTRLSSDTVTLIARYAEEPRLEKWAALNIWFQQCYQSEVIVRKICIFLLIIDLLKTILEYRAMNQANVSNGLSYTRYVITPFSLQINLIFLFNLLVHLNRRMTKALQYLKLCCCLNDMAPNYPLNRLLNYLQLPLEQVDEKTLNDFIYDSKWFLADKIDNAWFKYVFFSPILLSFFSFVFSFIANKSVDPGVDAAVKTTSLLSISLASYGFYKIQNNRKNMLRDKEVLSVEDFDYSALSLK